MTGLIDTPRIVQVEAQAAAVLRVTVPRDRVADVMGPGLDRVKAAVAAQGLVPTGPWFAHHLCMDPEVFDFEIGVPVDAPVPPGGEVVPGGLPAGRVARTEYRGPFEGLFSAWREFDAWVAAEGLTPRADLWEVYLSGPDTDPDPMSWRTELNRPLG
jgi:effector-binding domain-containing protein